MKFHCYTGAYDSVYDSDVEADTPVEAAAMAAREHGISGRWTVIPGEPVEVDVMQHATYEAALAGPDTP